MVAHSPLHRSRRAELPHRAPASGDDAKSPQGIGVADAGRRQPAVDEPPHALPGQPGLLAASPERAVPEPTDPVAEEGYRRGVHGHAVVAHVPANDRAEPSPHLGDGVVQAPPKLGLHLLQLGLQPLAHRLPQHREPSVAPLLSADVREAEEVEGLGLALTSAPPVRRRERAELDEARLVRVQLQGELAE